MIEPAVIAVRLLQYLGAMVLFGSSLFFAWRGAAGPVPVAGWPRRLALAAAVLLVVASLAQIAAQSVVLSGSVAEGLKWETLTAVVSFMPQGKSAIVRAILAAVAALCLGFMRPGRRALWIAALLGAMAVASLAWMGHAAATEGRTGWLHLASDMLHVFAAAGWIGALAAFLGLLRHRPATPEGHRYLHARLVGFAGAGSLMVAVLLVTGIVNSWLLVGPARLEALWTTPYGKLLGLKVLLFLAMLGLAAANRYRLTPALDRSIGLPSGSATEVSRLRRSISAELALGVAIVLLVAWFGTLEPPAAG